MYVVGCQRSPIMILEGQKGRGWNRFAVKLSKVKAYIDSTIGSSAMMLGSHIRDHFSSGKKEESRLGVCSTGVRSFVRGEALSFTEVMRSAENSSNKENGTLVQTTVVRGFDLFPLKILEGIEVVRSAVNYFDLEKKPLGLLDKKLLLHPLDKNHAERDEPSDQGHSARGLVGSTPCAALDPSPSI